MSIENQKSVCRWADAAFGETTVPFSAERALEEIKEFQCDVAAQDYDAAIGEAADVVIVLYRFSESMGLDLLAEVDSRNRNWISDGKGGGQHAE